MKRLKYFIFPLIILAMMFALVPTTLAAPLPCERYYRIQEGDTLRELSQQFGITPWGIIRANNRMMQQPNRPLYAGATLCIPEPPGGERYVPAHILDAPAATLRAVHKGGTLYLRTDGFAVGSNWWVKVSGKKLGKIKVVAKRGTDYSFNLGGSHTQVCLKNQLTDWAYCVAISKEGSTPSPSPSPSPSPPSQPTIVAWRVGMDKLYLYTTRFPAKTYWIVRRGGQKLGVIYMANTGGMISQYKLTKNAQRPGRICLKPRGKGKQICVYYK